MSLGLIISLALAALAQAPATNETDLRCGSYCLYVSLKGLDLPVKGLAEVEGKLGPPLAAGYSLGQLDEVARGYGAHTLAVDTSLENLHRRPGRFACIAHVRGSHFVNVADVNEREILIVDPPRKYTLPLDTFRGMWAGKALLIAPQPLLAEEELPRPLPWRRVVGTAGIGLLVLLFLAAGRLVWRARAAAS